MATRFLLDTNILSDLIRHPRGPVAQRLADVPGPLVCTSIVVACELRYGAAKRASTALTQRVEALLDCIPVLPLDAEADRHYAEIRTFLERVGQCIGGNDLLIAAHGRALSATLVTHHCREFARVPGLPLADWLA